MNSKNPHHTHLEHHLKKILSPFESYISHQKVTGILLIFTTIIAILWASIPFFSNYYQAFINTHMGVHFSDAIFSKPIKFWVNDVLLTIFFFFVGLEIKREFLVGELRKPKVANYVIFSAVGGMVIPALIYFAINHGTQAQHGWGIAMATDTAFAIGLLMFFKKSIPNSLFIFLASLAIIDDIGAIIVIATFYTDHLNQIMLLYALVGVGVLAFINYAGVKNIIPYLVIGIVIWFFIEEAGIHGTIAGILIALMIPARPSKGQKKFISYVKKYVENIEKRVPKNNNVLEDSEQHENLQKIEKIAKETTTPLQRIYSKIELSISLLILPAFALTNAGVAINLNLIEKLVKSHIFWGIFAGLTLGKPLGVLLMGRLSRILRIGEKPKNSSTMLLTGCGFLTGIGFTMSLFIGIITFSDNNTFLSIMKLSVMISSIISGAIGCIILWISANKKGENLNAEQN